MLFKKILQAALYIGISPTAYFIEPGPIKNDEIVKLALEKNNPRICLQQWSLIPITVTNPLHYNRWICLKDVAKTLKDPNICDLIKEDYYRGCILKVARADKKFSTCDKLVNDLLFMGKCYAEIIYPSTDEASCLRIKQDIARDNCLKHIRARQ